MTITWAAFSVALKDASAIQFEPGTGDVLYGQGGPVQELITKYWAQMQDALKESWKNGSQATMACIIQVQAELDALLTKTSTEVTVAMDYLRLKLQEFIASLIQQVVGTLPMSLSLAGNICKLDKISVGYKVKLSGNLSAALLKVCELVGEGELEITSQYAPLVPASIPVNDTLPEVKIPVNYFAG